ncbi:hypothetical protein [Sphingomonas soli]|uniref:hypothetical protein n=1 Tax=Sphingomonas soli TaxID=266127 RepID=UPI00083054DC|nr:hypothetical protein [Sphingomonas soli]
MDFDALLNHYFGTSDPEAIDDAAFAEGRHRLEIDFRTERDAGRKFALWALMDALGFAPLPAEAFEKDPAARRAAEDYLDAMGKLAGE